MPSIQHVRELIRDSKVRRSTQLCIMEGVRLLEEAIQSSNFPNTVFYSEKVTARGKDLIAACSSKGIETLEVAEDLLQRVSDTEQTQGVMAILPIPHKPLPAKLDFVVVLDTIRDPGNSGTILRTAAAAGVQAIWLTPGCVDVFSPKVLRSAMGAHFYLTVEQKTWNEVSEASKLFDLDLYLADSAGGLAHYQTDLTEPIGLVICNEAEGPSGAARDIVEKFIHIPMPGKFESLNASMAAAILIFEAVRQRTK